MSTLDDRLAPLAAQLAAIQEAREVLTAREADVKAAILELCPGPDRYVAGDHLLYVSVASRIDFAAVAAKYPASSYPELYSLVPDTKKVRHHLAPSDVEYVSKPGTPSVRLS